MNLSNELEIIDRLSAIRAQGQTISQPKGKHVGRNEPCPCGSGKKFKKCHLSDPTAIYNMVARIGDAVVAGNTRSYSNSNSQITVDFESLTGSFGPTTIQSTRESGNSKVEEVPISEIKINKIWVDVISQRLRYTPKTLQESMKTHGLLVPIIIDKGGTVLDGHARLYAAKNLGWTHIKVLRRG